MLNNSVLPYKSYERAAGSSSCFSQLIYLMIDLRFKLELAKNKYGKFICPLRIIFIDQHYPGQRRVLIQYHRTLLRGTLWNAA